MERETPKNQLLTEKIKRSFEPDISRGQSEFVPIPDQGVDNRYLCTPIKNEGGEVKASLWLDPKKWASALAEFSQFADKFGDQPTKLLILDHIADTGEHESVMIRPITIDRDGNYKESQTKFSLTPDGQLHFVYSKIGFDSRGKPERVIAVEDLGLLNSERVTREKIEQIKKTLSNPPIFTEE